jgi:hypothetical protein
MVSAELASNPVLEEEPPGLESQDLEEEQEVVLREELVVRERVELTIIWEGMEVIVEFLGMIQDFLHIQVLVQEGRTLMVH